MSERIAILGLGLMGSSLGLALKARGGNEVVTAYARREVTREEALRRGVADEVFADPAEAVQGAHIVVICVPILTVQPLLEACAAGLAPGAVVTDVGSTKGMIMEACVPLAQKAGACFVGSHPIAGSEQHGVEAGRVDLYEGAMTVVTPLSGVEEQEQVARVCALWERVGSATCIMSPMAHDRMLARTSHVPHLMASVLASAVGRAHTDEDEHVGAFCGTGFRDATRIADGSPDVWHDIVHTNADAIREELAHCASTLDALHAKIERGDYEGVRQFLEHARDARRALLNNSACAGEEKDANATD